MNDKNIVPENAYNNVRSLIYVTHQAIRIKTNFFSISLCYIRLELNHMENGVIEILLIEDDAEDAELTIYALRKNNLVNRLHHIDDGEKALEYLYSTETQLPKLILLDLRMPGIDGIQILKKLKGDPEKKHIPIVALLASREGKQYVESHHIRADGYITKPVDFKKFINVMAEIGLTWKIVNSQVV